jgi:glycosyltransferase involved in cell wall biosynthesis
MQPLVSLIIPTFNRVSLLGETIDSIIAQTFKQWELIVVDDGSTDHSKELLEFYTKRDNRIKYYNRPLERLKGPNACRNYGFELSRGKYINWLDSDDILYPKALKRKVDHIKSNDVIITTLNYINERKEVLHKVHKYKSSNLVRDYLVGKITFYTVTPLWRKEFLVDQEELFDEKISYLDDWDFNLRMLYKKPKMIFLDEALIAVRVHEASLSQQIIRFNFAEIKSELRARKKHLLINIKKGKFDSIFLLNLMAYRTNLFLRDALIKNSPTKYYLFYNLILIQILSLKLIGVVKSSIGFLSYSLFQKGYRFTK